MIELLIGDLVPYLIGGALALLGIWGFGKKRERAGREKERVERRMRDAASAAKVRRETHEMARDGDAVERLRDAGRLRD